MSDGPHTVLFFLDDEMIGTLPRSRFADPYFPVGNEVVTLDGAKYLTVGIRKVLKSQPGEVCVDVRRSGNPNE